jgi:hypothetical protein
MAKKKLKISTKDGILVIKPTFDFTKITNIRFSLLKKEKDIDESKAEFVTYSSASFKVPEFKDETEEMFSTFVQWMYEDIVEKTKKEEKQFEEKDSIGLWVDYLGETYENAIAISTMKIMQDGGVKLPAWEFIKMTIK